MWPTGPQVHWGQAQPRGRPEATQGGRWRVGESSLTHSVVVHLLERLVADGALEDDPLERVGLVTGHQLHTHHLPFPHGHVAEHLRRHEEDGAYGVSVATTGTAAGPSCRDACLPSPSVQGETLMGRAESHAAPSSASPPETPGTASHWAGLAAAAPGLEGAAPAGHMKARPLVTLPLQARQVTVCPATGHLPMPAVQPSPAWSTVP